MSIEWDDSFSTGVTAIDNQHRQLFDLLNQLEGNEQRGDSAAKMMEIVRSLALYAARSLFVRGRLHGAMRMRLLVQSTNWHTNDSSAWSRVR